MVYVPKTDSSTLCEGVSGGFMFFSFSSFSKIADMKFVLKQNMKKDEQGAGRWEEIKLTSSMTFGRCEPNWCFSVFAALAAAEHQHICSPLNSQWSAVEPEVIISWCHSLNDGFGGLERVHHKLEQVLCWMELLGLLLNSVLKDLGNISTQKRTSYVLKEGIRLKHPSLSENVGTGSCAL